MLETGERNQFIKTILLIDYIFVVFVLFFIIICYFFLGSIAGLGLNKDVTALLNECEQPGLVQTLLLPEDLTLRHLPALSVAHRRLDFTCQRPPLTPLDEVSITLTSLCASCAHKEFVWNLQCFTIFFLSLINNSKIVRNNWFNDSFVSSSVVKRPGTSVPSWYKKKCKRHGTRSFKVPVVPRTRSTQILIRRSVWFPRCRKRGRNCGT